MIWVNFISQVSLLVKYKFCMHHGCVLRAIAPNLMWEVDLLCRPAKIKALKVYKFWYNITKPCYCRDVVCHLSLTHDITTPLVAALCSHCGRWLARWGSDGLKYGLLSKQTYYTHNTDPHWGWQRTFAKIKVPQSLSRPHCPNFFLLTMG